MNKTYTKTFTPDLNIDTITWEHDIPRDTLNSITIDQEYIPKWDYTSSEVLAKKFFPTIKRIIVNKKKRATTVLWNDGTSTVVKRAKGDRDEPYFAVASAIAIKFYGSNSAFKSIIDDKIEYIDKNK